MNIEELRKINRTAPFRPFVIRTADGETVGVPHPDFLMIPAIGETVVAVDQEGGFHIIDASHVTKVEMRKQARRK